MLGRSPAKRRYRVMPSRGILGKAMQASVFRDRIPSNVTSTFDDRLHSFETTAGNTAFTTSRAVRAEIAAAQVS